jgi:hypothetical protein
VPSATCREALADLRREVAEGGPIHVVLMHTVGFAAMHKDEELYQLAMKAVGERLAALRARGEVTAGGSGVERGPTGQINFVALARKFIPVQSMPEGTMRIFDKDPEGGGG